MLMRKLLLQFFEVFKFLIFNLNFCVKLFKKKTQNQTLITHTGDVYGKFNNKVNKSIFASHTSNPKGHIILLIYLISI